MNSSVDVSPSNGFSQIYDGMNTALSSANPLVLMALTLIIVFYFIVFNYLGYTVSYPQQESGGLKFIEIVMWGLIVFLVLINGIQYFFSIDVKTAINNLFKGTPEVDVRIQPTPTIPKKIEKEIVKDLGLGNLQKPTEQVFNIPGNIYTYDDAKALCKAYDSKIATYDQIEDAYKSGAEWCNYGWSDNQLALFPTQKTTWHKLQKIKGHKNDCGRPGINGGFIANPNVRFGVNCYGNKPAITQRESEIMKKSTPYPLSKEDKIINKLVKKYKKDIVSNDILVSPFNYSHWNRY